MLTMQLQKIINKVKNKEMDAHSNAVNAVVVVETFQDRPRWKSRPRKR